MRRSERQQVMDFNEFAAHLDVVREVLRAQVAGLVQDGFSEEQARAITAGMFNPHPKHEDFD